MNFRRSVSERMWGRLTVLNRLASMYHGSKFDPKKLRGVVFGIAMSATLGEVACYRLVQQDVRARELPKYTGDLLIVVFSVFEAIIAPLVAWWGTTKRKTLLFSYTTACMLCCLSWYFMPPKLERENSELCDAANSNNQIGYIGTSSRTAIRFIMVLTSCIVFVTSRVACWSHGIAYCDEYAPARTSVHYGVLLMGRVIGLAFGHKVLTSALEDGMIFQVSTMLFGFGINWVQLPFIVPAQAPIVDGVQKIPLPLEDRSLFSSVGRVLYNSVAMTQILAMGIMATALWGYGYYDSDIVKVKYNLLPDKNQSTDLADIFSIIFVACVIAYAGTLFSAPILMEFCNLKAIKQAVTMSIFVLIAYIMIMTIPKCDRGNVAGLGKSYYGHPECSLACNCKPQWNEYKPVCVVDDMVTYMSPCHAGCSNSQEINGIQVYSNCTCASGGRVLEGACADEGCRSELRLHGSLYVIIMTFAILVFQAQGMILLRVVDPRDRAVAMGVAWSIVATLAFIIGQSVFYVLKVATCRWVEDEKCHLQNQSFPLLIGATCAFLVLTSIMTNITSWICIKMSNKNKTENFETRL